MALTQITQSGIVIQCMDEHYMPQAIVSSCECISRQSLVIHKQIEMSSERTANIWKQLVIGKIKNQARAFSILGIECAEKIGSYSLNVKPGDLDNREAVAVKEYFELFHPGLNRRNDDPINSCLN